MLYRLLCVTRGLLPMAALLLVVSPRSFAQADSTESIKVGIIGLDTSHVIAFTNSLNDPSDKDHVAGFRVVAGYKGGGPDVESSWNRVDNTQRSCATSGK